MMFGWEDDGGCVDLAVFWIAALLVTTLLLVRQPGREPPREDALTFLRMRFARGEVSQAEYERALDALASTR